MEVEAKGSAPSDGLSAGNPKHVAYDDDIEVGSSRAGHDHRGQIKRGLGRRHINSKHF